MIIHTRKKGYRNKASKQAATADYYQKIFDNISNDKALNGEARNAGMRPNRPGIKKLRY